MPIPIPQLLVHKLPAKCTFLVTGPGFVEIVLVQLSNKRRKIVVFEMHWKYILWKGIDIFDDKSVCGPGNEMG